jgi:hypothetical protein
MHPDFSGAKIKKSAQITRANTVLSKSDAQVQSGVNDILSFDRTLNYGIVTLAF